nr:biotin/lipoyl-containing protein [Alteraurantiacibacter aestuarii]
MGEFRLRIRRDGGGGWSGGDDEEIEDEAPPARSGRAPSRNAAPAPAPAPAPSASSGPGAGEVDVVAPLLGNFYLTPRPGEPPFVQLGDSVSEDTTIAIIEVMKLMNPIRAGVSGTVTAILAENGKPVEEGQPLVRVKVGG